MTILAERLAGMLGAKIDRHPSKQRVTVRTSQVMVEIEQVTGKMQVTQVFGHSEEDGVMKVHRVFLLNGTEKYIPEVNPTRVWLSDGQGASAIVQLRGGEVRVLSPKPPPGAYGSAR